MITLKSERVRKGISQVKLSMLAGLDPATLSRLESGRLYPYPAWQRRLAEALGWPVEKADALFKEESDGGGES